MAVADRIAVMELGDLQQYGTPIEIKERPSNLFVASFIGEPPMNIFAASVRPASNGLAIDVPNPTGEPAFMLRLSSEAASILRERMGSERPCRIGIRPHRIVVSGDGDHDTVGRIVTNHWLGDQSHVGLDIGGCTVIGVADGPIQARLGDMLPVRFPLDALYLFDAEIGRALLHGLVAQRDAAA